MALPVRTRHHAYRLHLLFARKRPRSAADDNTDDMNRWYESVDKNSSPEDIYLNEMRRQMEISVSPSTSTYGDASNFITDSPGARQVASSTFDPYATTPMSTSTASPADISPSTTASNLFSINASQQQQYGTNTEEKMTPKAAEAALTQYEAFRVADNWLDDQLIELMTGTDEEDFSNLDDEDDDEGHLRQEAEGEGDEGTMEYYGDPWDIWGEDEHTLEERERNQNRPQKSHSNEYLFDPENIQDTAADEKERQKFHKRLQNLRIRSSRLERARDNPQAATFFQREPNDKDYCDRMWVAAVDAASFGNLAGEFKNYGVEFATNFDDWEDGCLEDAFASIEDVASFKARQTYEATGLPAISVRTSFEIEPVPDLRDPNSPPPNAPRSAATLMRTNPRVISGYRFNDVGEHIDYIVEPLKQYSDIDRLTRFKTCLCYYDGEMEIYQYGICDVDIVFCNSMRTFVAVAQAIRGLAKTLEMTYDLTYQKWVRNREVEEMTKGARLKLRDRVLKEGRVLPNDIVDVSSFMDSMVDVNLMDECAQDLSGQVANERPSKILTVATTGLVLALPMAKYLQVPCVYARKERNMVMADTYTAGYSSKTVGMNRELLVSKDHIDKGDRVLIVDDFLSGGSSQQALLRIVADAGATPVGVAVLLEKVYDSGRKALSGYNIPVFSLCRIASVESGVIELMEEEGYRGREKRQQAER